jgi:hypothetical protein
MVYAQERITAHVLVVLKNLMRLYADVNARRFSI